MDPLVTICPDNWTQIVEDPALLQEFMNSGITFTSTNNSRIIDYNPEELIDDESATTSSITIDSSLDEQNDHLAVSSQSALSTESAGTESEFGGPNALTSSPEEATWTDQSVKLLISLIEEALPHVGKTAKFKSKAKMYEHVRKEMAHNGYNFTTKRITNKYFSLERAYKATKDHNKKTGRDKKSCPYQEELNTILQHRPSVNPVHVLGTSGTICVQDLFGNKENSSGDDDDSKESESEQNHPTKKRRTRQPNVVSELRHLRSANEVFHDRVTEIIENSEKKKIEIMTERNNLLKQLIDKL